MATPSVTRPLASVEPEEKQNTFVNDVVPYVKWIVVAAVVLGVGALVVVGAVTLGEKSRKADARKKWDIVYTAQKDKTKPEERIAALEGIAEQVKNSSAHAYVLSTLGQLHLEQGLKAERAPEERAASVKKAIALFEVVATNEPYKSNAAFGPQALQSLALAQEQAGDYDSAIKTLTGASERTDLESHFLYNKLVAELGRMHYMRSLKKPADSPEAQKDREEARKRLDTALKAMGAKADDENRRREDAEYISFLTYIKSLVDKPGRALPDGKAPPEKTPPAPAGDAAKKDAPAEPKKDDGAKKEEPAKAEPAKEQPKKPEGEKKAEEKKSSLERQPSDEPGVASRHASFAQLKDMLKNGNTSFCECLRCVASPVPASAKMIE
ncbi:MAG TPA: hypothetical protein VEJ63_13670 [Planctomycetota bacterium]|nr:hypothetical protein [Planctomycetota bacterium]